MRRAVCFTSIHVVFVALLSIGSPGQNAAAQGLTIPVAFLSQDHQDGAEFYPQLQLEFTDGSTERIPQNFVFDQHISEANPDELLVSGVHLSVSDSAPARKIVLLVFDVAPWLQSLGKAPSQIRFASLRVSGVPFPPAQYHAEHFGLVGLFAPPPSSTWTSPTLAGHALSWNTAGANGILPASSTNAPYPEAQFLQGVESAQDALTIFSSLDGFTQELISGQSRFSSQKLLDHMKSELVAGRKARFILFAKDRLGNSPGLQNGVWPSSAGADSRASRLARSFLVGGERIRGLKLTGQAQVPDYVNASGCSSIDLPVVGADNSLTFSYSTCAPKRHFIVRYNTSLQMLARLELSANCPDCPATADGDGFAVNDLHLLTDGSLVVVYTVDSARTGRLSRVRVARYDMSGGGFSLRRDTAVVDWPGAAGPTNNALPLVSSTVAPTGNVFVTTPYQFIPEVRAQLFEANPVSGQFLSRPVPVEQVLPPYFDLAGNMYLVWNEGLFGAFGTVKVHMMSLAPNGAERYHESSAPGIKIDRIPNRFETPVAVSDEGPSPIPGRLYVSTVTQLGNDRALFTIEEAAGEIVVRQLDYDGGTIAYLDGKGRVVARPLGAADGSAPILISRDGTKIEDSSDWLLTPEIAMSEGFANGPVFPSAGLQFSTLLDLDGRPVLAAPPHQVADVLMPSRFGIYATNAFGVLYHWERGAGGELSVVDSQPLDGILTPVANQSECTMPNANPVLVAEVRPDPPPPNTSACTAQNFFGKIGAGLLELDCPNHTCGPGLFQNTWSFCPTTPGVTWVVGNSPCFPDPSPSSRERWRTIRRFLTIDPSPARLRLIPFRQVVKAGQDVMVSAEKAFAPVVVQFSLSGDVSQLEAPAALEIPGVTLTLTAKRDAVAGSVLVVATSPDGEVARAVVQIKGRARLQPLSPDPNPAPTTVQKGGTFYRYYRIVEGPKGGRDRDLQFPDLTAVFKVRETNEVINARGLESGLTEYKDVLATAARGQPGMIVLKVPYTALQAAVTTVPRTLNVDLQHFLDSTGTILTPEEPLSFPVVVDARSYEKRLKFSTATELSAGLLAVLEGAGTVGFKDKDYLTAGVDAQLIEWEKALTVGGGFKIGGELPFGPFKLDGPEIKGTIKGTRGEAYKFEPATIDTAAQHFEILQAVEAARVGGAIVSGDALNPTRGLLFATLAGVSKVINPQILATHRESTNLKLAVKEALELNLQFGRELPATPPRDPEPQVPGFFLEISGFNGEHNAALNGVFATNANETSTQIDTDAKVDILKTAIFDYVICPFNSCFGAGYAENLTVDTTGGTKTLKSVSITERGQDPTNKPFEKTWTLEGADAMAAVRRNCGGNLGTLAYLARCSNCGPCGSAAETIFTAFKVSLLPSTLINRLEGTFREVPELKRVSWEQTMPQGQQFAFTIGASFGVGAKLSTSKEISQKSQGTRGVLLKPRGGKAAEFPLETYAVPDAFVPDLGPEEMQLGFLGKLKTALEAFSDTALLVEFELFGSQVGMIRHPPARRGGSGIPPLALDITYNQNVQVDVSAWPQPEPDPNAPVERKDIPATQPVGPKPAMFVAGAFHDFHQNPPPPDGTAQIVSATLSLGYLPSELGGIAESRLQMGRWFPGDFVAPQGRWDALGGTVNDANDTVRITSNVQEGIYTVLFTTNLSCPAVQPLTVSAGQVGVTWTAAPEADVNGYSVYRAPRGSDVFERIATVGAQQTTHTDLVPGETRTLLYAVAARFGPGAEGCVGAARATDGDGDQISDLYEIEVGLSPTQSNTTTDTDSDGLTDGEEVRIGTNPTIADTDGDGLEDGDEVDVHKTAPVMRDTDGDGALDGSEIVASTDPLSPDSDADGLLDGEETTYHCDPHDVDTDDDGILDGDEVRVLGTDPARPDTDRDGLGDLSEVEVGTNPLDWDTDGDGSPDGREVFVGTDPLDPNSFPADRFVRALGTQALVLLLGMCLGFGALLIRWSRRRRRERVV